MEFLKEAFTLKYILVALFLGTSLYVHFRGRWRYPIMRQFTGLSTLLAPYNTFAYLFSAVPNDPILDEKLLPVVDHLKKNWKVLRDEAAELVSQGEIKISKKYDDMGFNSFFRRGWKRFYLKWYGKPLPSARDLCPKTVEILQEVPSVRAAMFALLGPHNQLNRHRDPFAGSLRYHLGLITPNDEGCRINIDGTPRVWRDGEGFLWDATYVHRPKNETDQYRVILFCDVERPLHTKIATGINRFASRFLMSMTGSRNRKDDPIGFFNRLFGFVYPIRIAAKKLKRANRKVYYILKYALLIALLAWILL